MIAVYHSDQWYQQWISGSVGSAVGLRLHYSTSESRHQILYQSNVQNIFDRYILLLAMTEQDWEAVRKGIITKPYIHPEGGLLTIADAYCCDGLM